MRARIAIGAAALAATLAGAPPATAADATQTIRWSGNEVTHIGDLRTTRGPTLARATRAFGQPTSKRLAARELCIAEWSAIGLRVNFVNLGMAPAGQTTCSTGVGKVQSSATGGEGATVSLPAGWQATIRGRSFRTQRGLRVGDTTARLRSLHSAARYRSGSWWLAPRPALIGGEPGKREPIVRANMKGGKVAAFIVFASAAGD